MKPRAFGAAEFPQRQYASWKTSFCGRTETTALCTLSTNWQEVCPLLAFLLFTHTVFLGIPSLKTSLWFSFLVFQRIICLRLRRENLVIILSALPPRAPFCPSAIWESGKLGSRERKSFAQRWDGMAVARLGPGASLRTSWLFHRPLWLYHCHAELSGGPTLGRPMLVVRVSVCTNHGGIHLLNKHNEVTLRTTPNHLPTQLPWPWSWACFCSWCQSK